MFNLFFRKHFGYKYLVLPIFVIFSFFSFGVYSVFATNVNWIDTGSDSYILGNVGIQLDTPVNALDVLGSVRFDDNGVYLDISEDRFEFWGTDVFFYAPDENYSTVFYGSEVEANVFSDTPEDSAIYQFRRGRNVEDTPLPVESGDTIGQFVFRSYVGEDRQSELTASFSAVADGDPVHYEDEELEIDYYSAPGKLIFSTSTLGEEEPSPKLIIDNQGLITVSSLAGSGDRCVMVDDDGVLYNATCSSSFTDTTVYAILFFILLITFSLFFIFFIYIIKKTI